MRRAGPEWREAAWLYRLLHLLFRRFVAFAWRIDARGAGNFPRDGPVLLVANHHSYADGLVAAVVCPRPIANPSCSGEGAGRGSSAPRASSPSIA